ncbi:MAG: DUF4159 domain-containing protein [Anaerolineae bacterium]|nr:DUF4159 domain-containing protein [Anaerolineae bacterium]
MIEGKTVMLQELIKNLPSKRIKPSPGLAITADVWEEAHQYHRQNQGYLTLLSQGAGILAGLDVIASDPADTSVYILPGIAIDQAGQIIILSQPIAYDIGQDIEGRIHLVISYSESRPRAENGDHQEGNPLYIQAEFSITAQTSLPDEPHVELARIWRTSRDTYFKDAPIPSIPGPNEIDLRFRREVGAPPEVSIAVSYLGDVANKKYGQGMSFLAQMVNHLGHNHVRVDDDVQIGPELLTKSLVYLVGQGSFEMDENEMTGLRNYVRRKRGTLLLESLDAEAEEAFYRFLRKKELEVNDLYSGHPILTQPYLFSSPPDGFETDGDTRLLVGDGIILSTYNYGLLWQGERRGGAASRNEIRTAMEWGSNIIAYAASRQQTN